MYPENKVIEEILRIIENIREDRVDLDNAELLSKVAVKLSSLNATLSTIVAQATKEANLAYSFRKFQYARDYKSIRNNIDMKVKDADIEAMIKSEENQKAEIEAQYQADLLKSLQEDTGKLLSTLQTRCSQIKSERINTNGIS